MEDVYQEEFDTVASGASDKYPSQASALRKGGHVMLKGHATKIVDMSTSKTGKHGHAKVHIIGIDIFDGRKVEDISPSTHNMEVPKVKLTTYQILDCDDENFLSLMDDGGDTRSDIKAPDEMAAEIMSRMDQEDLSVQILAAIGREKVVNIKSISN